MIQYESRDPRLGLRLPVKNARLLKLSPVWKRRGDISNNSLCGTPGDSLYPHRVCLHARYVRGRFIVDVEGTHCGFIMSGGLRKIARG